MSNLMYSKKQPTQIANNIMDWYDFKNQNPDVVKLNEQAIRNKIRKNIHKKHL